ncbi:InlB B-repeat-containing protein, partial [Paenibacillus sp.]|uniref:InlB B-repeat-containing protein n=1 Tax=Paenibacillus sp. TaxID=58172 RepID=UPI0028123C2D
VESQQVPYHGTASEPPAPTKTGHTFDGWYTDSARTTAYNFAAPVTGNVTLYAKWTVNEYTVDFNTDGGSAVESHQVPYHGTASEPTAPTKTGHTFDGWYTDSARTTAYNFAAPVTGNVTLYAKWTVNEYTIDFDTDGGSTVESQQVPYRGTASEPPAPTKTGHTFDGWYTDSGRTAAYDFATPVTGNVTLYAKWTVNEYTIDFDTDGGSTVESQQVPYHGTASEPPAPTKTGHTFDGWYTDSGRTAAYDFATPVTGNVTLYAKWTVNEYTIDFDTDGGSTVENQQVPYHGTAIEPATPIKSGYTFDGWFSDSARTTAYQFHTPVTDNLKIYAKWSLRSDTSSPPAAPVDETPSTPSTPGGAVSQADPEPPIQVEPEAFETEDGRNGVRLRFGEEQVRDIFINAGNRLKTVEVPGTEPVIQVEFPSELLKELASAQPDAVIEVKARGAAYRVPVSLLAGTNASGPVAVRIAQGSPGATRQLNESAEGRGLRVVTSEPVEFELSVGGAMMTDFNGVYVERTISLREEPNPDEMTAIWLDERGVPHFVPSRFSTQDGLSVVTIFSPHNSVYAVVESQNRFQDMENHWAREEVELLANKLVVNGTADGIYNPDVRITRGEFVGMLVRSLGLMQEGQASFTDVGSDDWFASSAAAAYRAGIVSGYEDGSFRPHAYVTREQMAVMILRAVEFTGQRLPEAKSTALGAFADRTEIAQWAADAVDQAWSAGLMRGTAEGVFAPKEQTTRAECAVILKRVMEYVGFID